MASYAKSDTSHQSYNAPPGSESSIGPQIRTDYYQKKALIEAKKEQYFSQMADVTSMPKHFGKTIKRYHYLPLLDDANVNDQGIDAAGIIASDSATVKKTIILVAPGVAATGLGTITAVTAGYTFTGIGTGSQSSTGSGVALYAIGEGVSDAAADTAAEAVARVLMAPWITPGADYDADVVLFHAVGGGVNAGLAIVPNTGNLYGSSKDVGTISGKLPTLSEHGGRVNRIGFKRVELEGTIEKLGFFDEYTQESMDFDTDSELMMHVNREMVMGANEITEDMLQIDLLNGAGVIRYAGAAISKATLGTSDAVDVLTYTDLMKMDIDLDNNRCPKSTKIITGSRMIDTRVIDAARFMFIGSELITVFKAMKDLHNAPAFIAVQHYADAANPKTTNVGTGEIGSVDQYRIIVVPEMMHWSGAGAAIGTAVHRNDGTNYDVFPALVVGDASFTTIGFQTDGKTVKFKITHKKPGKEIADRTDPYGEIGFMSIKWYYGFMLLRPERIACAFSLAEL